MRTGVRVCLLGVLLVAGRAHGYGESDAEGFPSWEERVIHEWMNRSRSDPQADLADCPGSNCSEKACYAVTAPLVYDAAEAGDAFAREVWSDAVRVLVLALANYVTLVNPSVLVLGGGVVESVPALFEAVTWGVPPLTTRLARESLRIERARLGDWSGVVGAGALVARG